MKITYIYSAVSKINLSSMYEVILFLGKSMKYCKLTKMPKKSYDGLNNFDFMRQMKQSHQALVCLLLYLHNV